MIKTYDKYIQSDDIWLGNIPEHWTISSLKHFVEIISGYAFKSEDYSDDEGVPIIRIGDISNSVDVHNAKKAKPKNLDELERFIIKRGDLLLAMTGATIGKNCMYDTDEISYVNQRVGLLRGKDSLTQAFLKYYIDTPLFREFISLTCSGSAQENISASQVGGLQFPLPTIEEQTKIAQYLDTQTANIDQLIQQKERLIELLKEKRQAVINEAVTKGLKPNAKMKDSGIEWLGEVPEHWSVSFLKRFCLKITDGAHFSPKTEFEGRNYISVKDVDEFGKIDLINCKKISQTDFDDLVRNGCQPAKKDVLLTKDGTIGRAAVVKDDNDFVALSSLGIITPDDKKLDSDYLRLYLISGINVEQMFSLIAGAALTRLTIEKMKHLVITIPPINEQWEIVSRLENKVVGFDKSIEIISSQIEKLKEYRQSIISEAVTGKIDVRDWQSNKQEVA